MGTGGGWCAALCFDLSFSPGQLEQARAVLAWAERRSDVHDVRIIPGPAQELEADWQQLDPVWFGGNQRAL